MIVSDNLTNNHRLYRWRLISTWKIPLDPFAVPPLFREFLPSFGLADPTFLPTWGPVRTRGGWAYEPNDISGEIFRKLGRSANCRCSRQQRPIAVTPSPTGGGQPRLKRGHSPWSCQSSVGHGHAYTAAGPFGSSGSVRLLDRRLWIARYSLRIIQVTLGTEDHFVDHIDYHLVRASSFHLTGSSWRFPIIRDILGAAVFTGSHDTWSVRSVCNALLAFQGNRVRRYGSAVGPHRSLLKTFFSAIKQLHTSAFSVVEDHYRRHGSRRIGPHRSILKWRRITAFLKTAFVYLHLPRRLSIDFQLYNCVQHGWTWSNRSILRRWRKVQKNRGRSSERYLKVATWLLPKV